MAVLWSMAIPTVKSTYSLDVATVRTLETVARRWGVSKSEALRRIIRLAADGAARDAEAEALTALDELQRRVGLGSGAAAAWLRQVRSRRRAWSARAERPR